MTPAEHRANAERLMSAASFYTADPTKDPESRSLVMEATLLTAQAQVHATLALAPAAAPLPRPKPNLSRQVDVCDVELNTLRVMTSESGSVVLYHPAADWSTLLDDPAQVRLLADTLTAHADRLESKL